MSGSLLVNLTKSPSFPLRLFAACDFGICSASRSWRKHSLAAFLASRCAGSWPTGISTKWFGTAILRRTLVQKHSSSRGFRVLCGFFASSAQCKLLATAQCSLTLSQRVYNYFSCTFCENNAHVVDGLDVLIVITRQEVERHTITDRINRPIFLSHNSNGHNDFHDNDIESKRRHNDQSPVQARKPEGFISLKKSNMFGIRSHFSYLFEIFMQR